MMRDNTRQSFLGKNLDKVLATEKIAIVGLNGGGSHFAQQLANVGFKNYILCDPQKVDASNLNRNVLASTEAVANEEFKVDIAAKRILEFVPDAKITIVKNMWQVGSDEGAFDGCTKIIGCVDSLSERDQLERFARSQKISYIDIGMNIKENSDGTFAMYGQVVMTSPGGPCMRCLGLIDEENLEKEAALYGDAGIRPQVVWPNGTLASLGVGFLMSDLFDWSNHRPSYWLRLFDGNKMEVCESPYAKMLTSGFKNCSHF